MEIDGYFPDTYYNKSFFISFFFFKDGNLFTKIITALVPAKSDGTK